MSNTNTCMGVFKFTSPNKKMFSSIIKPLVETHTGLTYVDAMSHYESKSIKMDLISKTIEEANLVIADLSENNPNVFLELGIAYALKKSMILLCSEKTFRGMDNDGWKEKMPFDLSGRELLIFKDENDLKVQLGQFISDALFRTKRVAVSWASENEKNHVNSNSELEISNRGNIWSNKGINSNFTLSYHIKIHNTGVLSNPDIRLFLSDSPIGYPRIVIILPWELREIDSNKFECHIDYFKSEKSGNNQVNHIRLQQKPVRKISNRIKEFDVFVSFCWPNLVFESTFFKDKVDRLIVPMTQLRNLGYPIHLSHFIGFEAINNCHVTINNIIIKEIHI